MRPRFGRAREPVDWPVNALAGRRYLVVGDVMLGAYIAGDACRVCPEAAVPVVKASECWAAPGGVADPSGAVAVGGSTADYPTGSERARAVRAAGVGLGGLTLDLSRPTTNMLRVLTRRQQVIRVDPKSRAPSSGPSHARLVE